MVENQEIDYIKVRTLMLQKGVSQQQLLSILIEEGYFNKDSGHNAYVTLNFAISGKRRTKRYVDVLNKCYMVLDRL